MKNLGRCISTLAFIFWSGTCSAEVVMKTPWDKVEVQLFCLDGYLFAVAAHGGQSNAGRGVSIVQVFEPGRFNQNSSEPQPALCKKP